MAIFKTLRLENSIFFLKKQKSIFLLKRKKKKFIRTKISTKLRNCAIEIIDYRTIDRKIEVAAFVFKGYILGKQNIKGKLNKAIILLKCIFMRKTTSYTGFVFKKQPLGTSLVAQWIGLRTPSAGGLDSIPGWGTRSHMHAATEEPACHN